MFNNGQIHLYFVICEYCLLTWVAMACDFENMGPQKKSLGNTGLQYYLHFLLLTDAISVCYL